VSVEIGVVNDEHKRKGGKNKTIHAPQFLCTGSIRLNGRVFNKKQGINANNIVMNE
jgi:hypothetical protein